jgi:hypothetical protein
MKKRCPYCHAEVDLPERVGEQGYCRCGAYGLISLLKDASLFVDKAKKALGIDLTKGGRLIEVVDGGTLFEEKGEPAIIQWARAPYVNSRS